MTPQPQTKLRALDPAAVARPFEPELMGHHAPLFLRTSAGIFSESAFAKAKSARPADGDWSVDVQAMGTASGRAPTDVFALHEINAPGGQPNRAARWFVAGVHGRLLRGVHGEPWLREAWLPITASPDIYRAERQKAKFAALADEWRRETASFPTVTEKSMHLAYQRIIGMGEPALPFILRELSERGGHWFWALKAISGKDPVAPSDRGKIRAMRKAWLAWGRQHDLIT